MSLIGEGARITFLDASGSNQSVIYGSNISSGSDTVLEGFTITGGNSLTAGSGGGIWLNNASPSFINNIIKDNNGVAAGGIFAHDFSSPEIINNTIVNNSAYPGGVGGIYCYLQSHPIITNTTIANNSTGGVERDLASYPTIKNSIIWGNGGDQLWNYDRITYSDIEPEAGGGRTNKGTGNISSYPVFINPSTRNYHLHYSSLAIDAGTSEGAPISDIDGDPRPMRNSYDMGSDEYAGIRSIEANDASGGGLGIQAGDQAVIVFDQGTNGTPIYASNIDSILQLSNSHTWKDGTGAIGSAVWSTTTNTNDTLTITLSTSGAPPSVMAGAFGDNLTIDGSAILDLHGDPVSAMEKLEGVFGANEFIVNGDFETGDLTGWNIIEGTAFDYQPVDASMVTDSQGNWVVSSDSAGTGKIRSDYFIFSTRTIKFWIGGTSGNIKMYGASDGEQWWSQNVPSGYPDGQTEVKISRPEYTGMPAYIEITDASTSGYINVDFFHLVTEIYYAQASDASGGGPGIQAGDTVTIKFKGSTNGPPVDALNATIGGIDIDTVLQLGNGHTWKDGSSKIGGGIWSTSKYENDTLTIILSANGGAPTVEPGDRILLNEAIIKDNIGNPVVNPPSPVTIVGHFGIVLEEGVLVAEWHFDENEGAIAFDSSGNDNDGDISGATWTTGNLGPALQFDGVDDYVEVPDSPTYDITNQMTLEAWIYPTGNLDIWPTVIDKYNYYFYVYEWEGMNGIGLWFVDSAGNWHGADWYEDPSAIPLNTWSHIVGTFDGYSMKIYYNGELKQTNNVTAIIDPGDYYLRIGNSDPAIWGYEYPFMGKIDEVMIYNYALSPAEVIERYIGSSTLTVLSAEATDASGGGIGIQAGDEVIITFDGATEGTAINASNIATALALSNGHTWLDGSGNIGSAVWSTTTYANDTLTITLSDTGGAPIVAVGDAISLNGMIKDSIGKPIISSINITGAFGPPPSSVSVSSAEATDASGGGIGIQAGDQVVITFDGATEGTAIDASNITTALALSNSHTWLDGSGNIGSAVWSTTTYANDTLTITLSDTGGTPTVSVGDTISLNGMIKDSLGEPIISFISITGAFGPPPSSVSALSAVAFNASGGGTGIQAGDEVVITFDGATEGTAIDASNIDTALALSNGYTWLDGSGNIGSAVWSTTTNTNDTLTITLSKSGGAPTVTVGDTITLDGTIKDSLGNPVIESINITGSFGPPLSGAVAYWKFDENAGDTAYDSVGSNNGIIYGANWATGRFGSALSFDGVDDYVYIPSDSNIYGISDAITLEAWVYHNALGSNIQRYITTPDEKAVIRYDGASGIGLHFYINVGGNLRHLRPNIILTPSTWYHVVGTYDGSMQRLYLNGNEIASQSASGSLVTTTGISIDSSAGDAMNGLIDEAIIYNTALTADEIRARTVSILEASIVAPFVSPSKVMTTSSPVWMPIPPPDASDATALINPTTYLALISSAVSAVL